jgi:hypothetical protein
MPGHKSRAEMGLNMAHLLFAWIKNHLGNKFYPYTHSDAVYVDDTVPKNLTTALDEIDGKINQVSGIQSDWNENDSTKNTYIKNKPSALPANGGNADTLNGLSSSNFAIKENLDGHLSDEHAHENLFNSKLDTETANKLIKGINADTESGIITITRLDNTIFTINIPQNIILQSASFNESTNEIVIIWSDGSESKIPVEGLVDIYTGFDNDIIQITVANNIISAIIKEGSISSNLLSPDVKTNLNRAHTHDNLDAINKISSKMIDDLSQHMSDNQKHLPSGGVTGQIVGMTETGIGWVEQNNGSDNVITKVSELENDLGYVSESVMETSLLSKVDKIDGMGLSENNYTNTDKEKLNGIDLYANNYTHPNTHPATMISEDDAHKFVTSEEKSLISNGISNVTFDEETSVLTFKTLQGDKNIDLSSLQKTITVGKGDEITPGFNEDMVWHQLTFQNMNLDYSQCKYMKDKFFILTKTNYWLTGDNPETLVLKDIKEMDTTLPDTVVVGNIFFIEDKFYICSYNSDANYTFNLYVTDDFVNYEKYSSSHLLNGIEGIEKINGKYVFAGKLTTKNNMMCVFYINTWKELENDVSNHSNETNTILSKVNNKYPYVTMRNSKLSIFTWDGYICFRINEEGKLFKCSDNFSKYKIMMDNRLFYLNFNNSYNNNTWTTERIVSEFNNELNHIYREKIVSTHGYPGFPFMNGFKYGNAAYMGGKYLVIKNDKGIFLNSLEELIFIENEDGMFSISNQNIESLCHNYEYILLGTQDRYLFAKIS